jgi:hypothetical protein
MPYQLVRDVTNEVSEYEGVLLVRLGRGSAMQVRMGSERPTVLFRVVPIAKATQLESDSPWQVASDSQLRAWIHPDSAIGRWLVAKGVDSDRIARPLDENALPAASRLRRFSFLALKPKSSMSVP